MRCSCTRKDYEYWCWTAPRSHATRCAVNSSARRRMIFCKRSAFWIPFSNPIRCGCAAWPFLLMGSRSCPSIIRRVPGRTNSMTSLSLAQIQLDHLLVQKVVGAGGGGSEQHSVDDFLFEDNRVTGVKGRDKTTGSSRILRRWWWMPVVAMDCLCVDWSWSNRIGDLERSRSPLTGKIFSFHVITAICMSARRVIQAWRPSEVIPSTSYWWWRTATLREGMDSFYQTVVMGNERRQSLLSGARPKERVRSVGSLAYDVRPVPCGGLVLAGDTTGFIDPFTGEGIYLSLRSAQLVSGIIHQAFSVGDFSREFLSEYEQKRQEEFCKKFILSRLLQKILYRRRWCDGVVALLRRNPQMAQTLVG